MTSIETDGYGWAVEQADALRRRSANEIDWDSLAEEIDYLAGSHLRELRNRYAVLLAHLLKWIYQPSFRSRSGENTITEQREAIAIHLEENPTLKSKEAEQFAKAYKLARLKAERETGMDLRTFPNESPFTLEQARAEDWLPGSSER